MEPRALPQRITFLAGTLGQGGAERQLFYILQALRDHGVGLRLLCLTQGEFWEQRIREELHVPVAWVGRSRLRLGRLLRIVLELRRQVPDVIQSQHFFTNLYVAGAARILGRPEIGAIRNNVTSEVGDSLLGRLSLKSPRYLAANSQAAVATAIKMGVSPSRCSFLPNVVDTARFHPAPAAGAKELRLLAVGRLVTQKRLDRFIRVVGQVHQQATRPVKAVIVGSGPERARLQQQVGESGLEGVIEFRGTTDNVASEYQRAAIFVLTSDFEGTPNVVLEAMASGLAVVSTAAGGVTEIVRHGETGLIAQGPDENGLVAAVLQLANDLELRRRLGESARRYVQECHSLEALPRFLKALYQKRNA